MYAEQQNKTCTKCKQAKSLDNYHLRSRKNQTYMPVCKPCRKEGQAGYYQRNKARINPSRYEYNKQYAKAHPEKIRFWANQWREINHEFSKELHRRYYRKNKKKRHANGRLYELRKIKATPRWLTKEQRAEITNFYVTCPEGHHVDHIIPLRGKTVSGLHVPWNLQHLPAKENLKKGNR